MSRPSARLTKLNVKPNLIDTVKLRPEVEYRITPSPIAYGFEVSPIRPASVNIDLYRQPKPLLCEGGFGISVPECG